MRAPTAARAWAIAGALAALLAGGCACPCSQRARQAGVEAALRHYSDLVLRMDGAAIASLFTPDGEMQNHGQPPVRGRADIGKFLAGFKDYHVLVNEDTATSTVVDGDTAVQQGTYHQKVVTPSGETVEVSGKLTFEWLRDPSGDWKIQRVSTSP